MHHFKITKEINNLDLENIRENLFNYSYRTKNLRNFDFENISEDTPLLSSYSSFKGEVYENIIYEFLLYYASNEPLITRFVLKGPHQSSLNKFAVKSGMTIDKSSQIVYKSAYKDITEYDALFFTKDSVYFVEMSITKKTASLNKRLNKKHALLKVLFPSLIVRALVVLTEGSMGISKFPSYCTIWLTKDFEDNQTLKELVHKKQNNSRVKASYGKKFVEAKGINYVKFGYFQTLEWILTKSRSHSNLIVDLNFFKAKKLQLYFDIFTKLYIGYISSEELKTIFPKFDKEARDDRIFVTIEKINRKSYDIVYYVKEVRGKLKRVALVKDEMTIKDKDPEGFTNVEVRFISKVLQPDQILTAKTLSSIRKNILKWK